MDEPQAVGVVLAAGMGTRVGADGNKAFLQLAGRSMVSWSVDAVASIPAIARTVLVYRRGERDLVQATMVAELPSHTIEFVEGGDSRHGSERNVLEYLAADIEAGLIDVVLIHDAARPLAGQDLMAAALTTARQFGGAIPAVPADDVASIDSNGLVPVPESVVRVQTPQAFRATPLLDSYRRAAEDGFEGTDTSSCVERYTRLDVRAIAGSRANLKVTFAADVRVAERLLHDRVSR